MPNHNKPDEITAKTMSVLNPEEVVLIIDFMDSVDMFKCGNGSEGNLILPERHAELKSAIKKLSDALNS
jgi:hypothetical protein